MRSEQRPIVKAWGTREDGTIAERQLDFVLLLWIHDFCEEQLLQRLLRGLDFLSRCHLWEQRERRDEHGPPHALDTATFEP